MSMWTFIECYIEAIKSGIIDIRLHLVKKLLSLKMKQLNIANIYLKEIIINNA